ncbi:mannose-1-phosphate guanyltransferase-like [Pelobates cultripes]|uniref:Mannose-1-phosphate guanyltransferase-like n=1 Tax=Pelobates cultripes TaxID=61616 RepID=A0AAD1WHK3_PELCU|nr:mannose-1-phosphate guanyltransferase-like [Pelobates cultripes]
MVSLSRHIVGSEEGVKMKAVILAAGYGTRLLRDLHTHKNEQFRHLIGIPKPLLPIGECPLISYWVDALEATEISEVIVVTNDYYHNNFKEWAQKYKSVTLINDGSSSNEDRLGAVSCLQLAIDKIKVNDHILVIGGDTLFYEDFHLKDVIRRFQSLYKDNASANLVLSYTCKDEETRKYGILETDEDQRVRALREKPSPTDTTSRQACPCFYVLSKDTLQSVREFLQENKDAPLEEKDAPGHFLSWLVNRNPVYVYQISGRFDVGNLESYITCDRYFQEKIKNLPNYLQ